MRDDYRKIIISRIFQQGQNGSTGESLNKSPASRWAFYLALIPMVIVVVVLGAFFFSVVLALFTAVAATVGARLWWLRRKLRQSMAAAAEPKHNAMIEDAEIIETVEDNKRNHERY